MVQTEIDVSQDVFLPCYHHLLESTADIHFLWGGRDSGKSYFIGQRLILKCLSADYFRCILVKKTYESIHDTQGQTIKDIVNEWGLQEYFHFKESPLEIICANGNKFIARGCDKPEKLKSITNPSDVWYEEGNQLSEQDYVTISTTLRTNEGRVQEWFSFNPEFGNNPNEHWLIKNYIHDVPYYDHVEREKEISVKNITLKIKFTSTHTWYEDNPHCSQDRIARHEILREINPYYYQVFTLGKLGRPEVKRPFAHNFNRDKHVRKLSANQHPIRFVLDFNLDPFVCLVMQIWSDNTGHHVHFLDEIVLQNGDVYQMCEKIKTMFSPAQLSNSLWTGDTTSRKRSIETAGNLSAWQIIDKQFNLGKRLQLPASNPRIEESRHLLNAILHLHNDVCFNEKMTTTISEMMYCEVDEDGAPIKKDRNKMEQRFDACDCVRYACSTWLNDFIDRLSYYQKR